MTVRIVERGPDSLETYAEVPIAFDVESRYQVEPIDRGLGGVRLVEEPVDPPTVKTFDEVPEGDPTNWPTLWDVSSWGFFLAMDGPRAVGAAAVVWDTADFEGLDGRSDLAVLFDLRVHPDERGREIGSSLFDRVVDWATARDCTRLTIETQSNNVPACRFYAHQGCELGEIVRDAYPAYPAETKLVWFYELAG